MMSSLQLAVTYSADKQYDLATNAVYLSTGFIIVIGALSILWAICFGVGWMFTNKSKNAAQAKKSDSPEEAPSATSEEDTDPALIAVIAAAVQVTLHRPMRIRSVRSSHHPGSNEVRHNAWALEGRSSHFQSHKVR